jgi:hypothetical protein
MYIVIDKKTKEIIHINPAPFEQNLDGEEVYHAFNPKTMLITRTNFGRLPEHFNITADGTIQELSLQEKVNQGIIKLSPREKIKDDEIVLKTLSEQVKDGLITLAPTEKIAGRGDDERIAMKSPSEQIAEGLLTLLPSQKLVGSGENEEIVDKTLSEQVAEGVRPLSPDQKIVGKGKDERIVTKALSEQIKDGVLTLAPHEKLVGKGENERIVEKTKQEMLDEGSITLEDIEEESIQQLRQETEVYFMQHKTKSGYRLDALAREKANLSLVFRLLPEAARMKKEFLERKLIYPDDILDEILGEIETVQRAYDEAKETIKKAKDNKERPDVFEGISLDKHLPENKRKSPRTRGSKSAKK